MTQHELFHDDLYSALRATVEVLGGAKRVGAALWPAMTIQAAQQQLLNALNPDKPHKLSLDEIVHIARLGRREGVHAVMEYLCASLDYETPRPVTQEAKQTALLERWDAAKKEMAELARLMGAIK